MIISFYLSLLAWFERKHTLISNIRISDAKIKLQIVTTLISLIFLVCFIELSLYLKKLKRQKVIL